jgi:hypothetical protein
MADFGAGNPPIGPETEGPLTDPTSGTLMADSGAVPHTGLYRAYVGCNSTAAATFSIQRRNAANGANVGDVLTKYVTGTAQFVYLFNLVASERVRVVMGANLTGNAAADVWLEQAH